MGVIIRAGPGLKREGILPLYYFTTTLTISPMKNAQVLNEVVQEQCDIYGIKRLPTDLKKKGGYKRSIQLSHEYNLYRQNFCGCVYSMREAEEREAKKERDI